MNNGRIQTLPTTMVTGYWDPGSTSEEPENVKIVMSNRKRVLYRIVTDQPRPEAYLKPQLDKFTDLCIGYERK